MRTHVPSMIPYPPGSGRLDVPQTPVSMSPSGNRSSLFTKSRYGLPVIDSMNPDESVLALASIEFDVSPIEEGQSVTIKWRGLPVFVRHRTQAEIEEARAVPLQDLKDPQPDEARVAEGHEQFLIMVANCTGRHMCSAQ